MEITLNVEVRESKGTKNELSTMRAGAKVPAVVYGGEKPPINLSVSEKDIVDARRKGGVNAILHLKHGKGTETVMIKSLQRHPVTDRLVHADFLRVSMTQKIEASVPLVIVGEAPGVKDFGGMLAHDLRMLKIKALPNAIPPHVEVDVSKLGLHQSLHVKDLKVAPGVEVLDDAEHVVVHVTIAKVEEVAAPAAPVPGAEGAATAEPESSSTKGKKDEEGKLVKETAKTAAPAAGDKKEAAKKEPAKKEGK
ncbi:MAG: 50S ribosomal protein L25 [Elusimicrobia bacterium]|nr:50S ribosomal protein L25 [Elusimicrobiota bacterium]